MSNARDAYPADRMTLREVGLRDGLQLVKRFPATTEKLAWIGAEYAAGVRHFEVGSFLPPERVPQFADVRDLIRFVASCRGARSAALALNERGLADALQTPLDEIVCVVSATEEHSQANMRRSRSAAVALVEKTAKARDAAGHKAIVNVGISMAFGCSLAGEVAEADVLRLVEQCLAAGADAIGIADTVGYAGPRQVAALTSAAARLCGNDHPLIVHLHDTRGLGLANASAAMDAGCRVLDGALGGLGGCPFAPGASGNVVFEDLAFLAESKGFATGIDIAALAEARAIAAREMPGEAFTGAIARAGLPANVRWHAAR